MAQCLQQSGLRGDLRQCWMMLQVSERERERGGGGREREREREREGHLIQ